MSECHTCGRRVGRGQLNCRGCRDRIKRRRIVAERVAEAGHVTTEQRLAAMERRILLLETEVRRTKGAG